jgi:hypothetical protein
MVRELIHYSITHEQGVIASPSYIRKERERERDHHEEEP